MKKANAEGFLVVWLATALLIVGAVGAGWYVWHTHSGQPATEHRDRGASQHVPSTSDPTEGGSYFAIKDWGVRFPLPKDLQGDLLHYESNTASSGTVIFASKRLNALTGDTSCDLIKQPDGSYAGGVQASLSRINPKTYPAESLQYYRSQLTHLKDVGTYEYYARRPAKDPPVTCLAGKHEKLGSVEQAITDELNTAFANLSDY